MVGETVRVAITATLGVVVTSNHCKSPEIAGPTPRRKVLFLVGIYIGVGFSCGCLWPVSFPRYTSKLTLVSIRRFKRHVRCDDLRPRPSSKNGTSSWTMSSLHITCNMKTKQPASRRVVVSTVLDVLHVMMAPK